MDFRTMVELPASLPPVTHAGQKLLLGSCFAENMGRRCRKSTSTNPVDEPSYGPAANDDLYSG